MTKKTFRILYLMTEPFGIGGVQSDMLALSEDFTKLGHQVFVLSGNGPLVSELEAQGAKHIDIDLNFHTLFDLIRSVKKIIALLHSEPVDIIAPQSVRSTIVVALARVFASGPKQRLVTTVHNIHSAIHYHTAGWILNAASDFVIFESHYERNRLLAKGLRKEKTAVIHSGIDLNRFLPRPRDTDLSVQYGIAPDVPTVGIIARFSEEKGHTYLVQAFREVLRRIPTAVLFLVGDGPLKEEVASLVLTLGIDKQVIFTGIQRDVPRYLSLFDLFVLASTRESFPLSAREAMAAGIPVVATQVGGCAEVVEEGVTGCLVPSANIEALAAAICAILADRKKLEQMGKDARLKAEREFSRTGWVEGNEAVYLDAVHGKKLKEGGNA